MNSKIILIILITQISNFSIAQNRVMNFTSDYQNGISFDGTNLESRDKATIFFSDPKSLTKEGTEFEKLPKGIITIKFNQINQIKEKIIFIGKHKMTGADIYSIITEGTSYDIIYILKSVHKIGAKSYSHMILLGRTDENNLGTMPKYFSRFHCNLIN